ncbi:hypothetical protein T459_28181 [Capsicum annuum]|uniref:Uncharacterized protein n=1 Tax=Capsicum annuum TaxID=4072 RepID=A0A2G2YG23_CAPAN|nr:hypothetical protein T459_28181 [Capsicum annuum]
MIAMKNEKRALKSRFIPINAYSIDLGEDFYNKDEKDNVLDIWFGKVARKYDISPRLLTFYFITLFFRQAPDLQFHYPVLQAPDLQFHHPVLQEGS